MGYNAKNTHGGVSYILKAALSGNNGCKTKNTHKGCFLCFEYKLLKRYFGLLGLNPKLFYSNSSFFYLLTILCECISHHLKCQFAG